MKNRFLGSVAMACIAVGLTSAAHAQEAKMAGPEQTESDEPHGVGEILVTAQKRSESAQDIPLSVTAIGGDELATSGVKDLFQAVTLVPGVVFSRAPDDGLALTFRGLGTQARPQAFEQSVALFTDGVFIGKGRLYSTSFFDVERMEFIKGTQSTLLGKNASLGAISVVTRQPKDWFSVEGRGSYEFENGGYTMDAAADLPLADGAAVRVAGHYNDLDGWVRNDFSGHDGPEQKDLGLRATLRLDLTDTLRITASHQYANNRQFGASYQLIGEIPAEYGEGDLDGHTSQFTARTSDGETYHRTRSHISNLKAELDVGDHTLISQSSYIRYKLFFNDDFDFSIDDSINFVRDEKYRQYGQEIRVQSPAGGTLEYMAGLFYMSSRWNSVEQQLWAVPDFPPPPDPASGQLFNGPFENNFDQNSKAYSAFASGTFNISPDFRFNGGLRWTRETKDVVYGRNAIEPLTVWNQIANPPFDSTPLEHNSNFVDGNASLEYDITPDVMVYASFGHGSKSGGFVETNTIAVPPPLLEDGKVPVALVEEGAAIKDEFTTSYEIGFKSTLFDSRLLFNFAGFWTDIKNFQDTVFTGGPLGFITFNGPARSRGVEVETVFQVTPELRLDGGLTYADSTGIIQPIDAATSAPQVDENGDPVLERFRRSQAPKLIFNVGANYETPVTQSIDLRLGGSVRRRSGMFNQRQEMFFSPSLTTLDLSAGVQSSDERWGVDLIAKNVTNEVSEDFASPSVDPRFGAFYGAYLAGPNPLRTITLAVRFSY